MVKDIRKYTKPERELWYRKTVIRSSLLNIDGGIAFYWAMRNRGLNPLTQHDCEYKAVSTDVRNDGYQREVLFKE